MTVKKSGRGERELKVRVKSKRKSQSSKLWLERQLNDPYVARAKREGFRSRAAFKLIEIDDKHHVLKGGARVVDLGAAPGGWSQVAAKRIGARGRVVGIDVLLMDAIAGVDFAQIDFLDPDAPDKLKAMLGGPADVVLSDMAANATGHRPTDHLKIMALVEAAAQFAARSAQARWLISRQGDPRRHRERAAGVAQARLRHGEARQASGEPLLIRRSFTCWRADFAARDDFLRLKSRADAGAEHFPRLRVKPATKPLGDRNAHHPVAAGRAAGPRHRSVAPARHLKTSAQIHWTAMARESGLSPFWYNSYRATPIRCSASTG